MGLLGARKASLFMEATVLKLFTALNKMHENTENYWIIYYCDHEQAHPHKW